MLDFKAKMHLIQFWLASAPDPAGGLQRSPDPIVGWNGPTTKEMGGGKSGGEEGKEGEGREIGDRREREGKG